jgi:hypothetical protein
MNNASLRAPQAALWSLWWAVAKALHDHITATPPGEIKAHMLNVARAFLADNGIVAGSATDPRQVREDLSKLIEDAPSFDEGWSLHLR